MSPVTDVFWSHRPFNPVKFPKFPVTEVIRKSRNWILLWDSPRSFKDPRILPPDSFKCVKFVNSFRSSRWPSMSHHLKWSRVKPFWFHFSKSFKCPLILDPSRSTSFSSGRPHIENLRSKIEIFRMALDFFLMAKVTMDLFSHVMLNPFASFTKAFVLSLQWAIFSLMFTSVCPHSLVRCWMASKQKKTQTPNLLKHKRQVARYTCRISTTFKFDQLETVTFMIRENRRKINTERGNSTTKRCCAMHKKKES